ncbi:MAG: carboxypeptidase-like regulatory domain-containing protein [Thermoguttaceae bacterium]
MKNFQFNLCYILLVSIICLTCFGCGKGYTKVSGKVTLPDGTIVSRGEVYFEGENFSGFGTINKDGSYHIGALNNGEGVPPGTYKIAVRGVLGYPDVNNPTIFYQAIDPKYSDIRFSGLTCEVEKKSKVHDIIVEINPQWAKINNGSL